MGRKSAGEIVQSIIGHGEKIFRANVYPGILNLEMERGGYKLEDPDYDEVRIEVVKGVNAFRRLRQRKRSA